MGRFSNLVGKKFGRLTVVEVAGKYKFGGNLWRCKCDCGGETIVRAQKLNSGHSKSCGCLVHESGIPRRNFHYAYRGTQLYNTFYNIKKRCENPKCEYYYCYGARGIICEWKTFEDFLKDMEPLFKAAQLTLPNERLSIERLDVNGNYCKANCVWIPLREQTKNMTTNRRLTFHGQTMNVADWGRSELARNLGLNKQSIKDRLRLGWDSNKIFTTPIGKQGTHLKLR